MLLTTILLSGHGEEFLLLLTGILVTALHSDFVTIVVMGFKKFLCNESRLALGL
jgi:hypothetical protein